jgi:hypothetical protein
MKPLYKNIRPRHRSVGGDQRHLWKRKKKFLLIMVGDTPLKHTTYTFDMAD